MSSVPYSLSRTLFVIIYPALAPVYLRKIKKVETNIHDSLTLDDNMHCNGYRICRDFCLFLSTL